MDRENAQEWLDAYVAAWRSNDADQIGLLFADDVSYRYHPWDDPVIGRAAVVESWLADPDDPDGWEARYTPFAVDGRKMVATGTSRYRARDDRPGRVYHNCFLVEIDDEGRCRSFTEYYLEQP